MLRGIDVLVFDIQDVGVHFYTYETTMAYGMEAAAKAGIPYFVLDRPDPITGVRVRVRCSMPPMSPLWGIWVACQCGME